MTYSHLTTDELVMIESYYHNKVSTARISELVNCSKQTVHIVVLALKQGITALEYYRHTDNIN